MHRLERRKSDDNDAAAPHKSGSSTDPQRACSSVEQQKGRANGSRCGGGTTTTTASWASPVAGTTTTAADRGAQPPQQQQQQQQTVEQGTDRLAVPCPSSFLHRAHHASAATASTCASLMVPSPSSSVSASSASNKSRIFPSTRFFIALLLCFCYISLGISTSNISVAVVCMVRDRPTTATVPMTTAAANRSQTTTTSRDGDENGAQLRRKRAQQVQRVFGAGATRNLSDCAEKRRRRDTAVGWESCHEAEKLDWAPHEKGIAFAAQNVGSLLMLYTGSKADRLNGKWTIVAALALLVLSNGAFPYVADWFWLAFGARVLTGVSDALLQPSTSSLITRWFPPKERPFAIGLITGGRQIGAILIQPLGGVLCEEENALRWPMIFWLSGVVGAAILLIWLLFSADKPSKHFCTSLQERFFVEQKIAEEKLGKRTEKRPVPWRQLARCVPLYAGVGALICHEYPLVIMLQFLPSYNKVLNFKSSKNGLVSALPIAILFVSKTLSSSLASFIQSNKKGRLRIERTPLAKWCNGIASLGLGLCMLLVPLFAAAKLTLVTEVFICLANAFAGLHTPGVQTALLQIAPAYTGIVTGIAFGCVAVVSVVNKIITFLILNNESSLAQWNIVFWIAGFIALLPVLFFSVWGSADRQAWASTKKRQSGVTLGASRASRRRTAEAGGEAPHSGTPPGKGTHERGAIFTVSAKVESSTAEGTKEQCELSKVVEEAEEEDEEQDFSSAHFEPEAAVASALRLQMFLEDPEQQSDEEEQQREQQQNARV